MEGSAKQEAGIRIYSAERQLDKLQSSKAMSQSEYLVTETLTDLSSINNISEFNMLPPINSHVNFIIINVFRIN